MINRHLEVNARSESLTTKLFRYGSAHPGPARRPRPAPHPAPTGRARLARSRVHRTVTPGRYLGIRMLTFVPAPLPVSTTSPNSSP